jgi:hypothetical protein
VISKLLDPCIAFKKYLSKVASDLEVYHEYKFASADDFKDAAKTFPMHAAREGIPAGALNAAQCMGLVTLPKRGRPPSEPGVTLQTSSATLRMCKLLSRADFVALTSQIRYP